MMQFSFLRPLLLILCGLMIGGTGLYLGGSALLSSGWQTVIPSSQPKPASRSGDTDADKTALADSLKNLSPVELGEQLYRRQGCVSCHSLDGSKRVGPSFKGLYGKTGHEMGDGTTLVVDETYLREAIVDGDAQIVAEYQNVQPASYENLPERKLSGLVAFIKAQSKKSPPEK